MKTIGTILIMLLYTNILYSTTLFQKDTKGLNNTIKKNEEQTINTYEVTETINMPFGSSKITYLVSNKKLIHTNDLGPNNTRVVKEKIKHKKTLIDENIPISIEKTVNVNSKKTMDNENTTKQSISINPLETYERMAEKGIQSIDIYKKLGDSYFYKNDYNKASKYYDALFKLTSIVEPEYYFRYSQTLKNIGQPNKSLELMNKYKSLTIKPNINE